jgi:PD-(D/E)XK nuclease superfamily
MTAMSDEEAARQLEMASAEIHRLGEMLSTLNLFRAAGMSWSELRHSNFLAFLLSPIESHRLGDKFLKRFLHHVLVEHRGRTDLSPEVLSSWSVGDTQVYREWKHIDILLLNFRLGLAVIIENKTGSPEHDDQLKRYRELIALQSPRTPKVLGLFLSPARTAPSDKQYLPISYRTVLRALEDVRQMPEVSSGFSDLNVILRHYSQLIEEDFMEQPQAATIA